MYFRTLTVLMWRHWLSRLNEVIPSVIEILVPILPFILIYLFREDLFSKNAEASVLVAVVNPESVQLRNTHGPPCVLYTPETNFTRILMDLVSQKLNLPLLKRLDTKTKSRGYFPFSNAFTIFEYTKSMGPDAAVVVFHNVLGLNLPESLNYSIRMKTPIKPHKFLTEIAESEYDLVSAPQIPYGVNEPFMRLQWAIDTSFIQMLTGKEVKQKITLQELPYAKYSPKSSNAALKFVLLFLASNFAMLPAFYTFILRMMIERASGIQELMKMSGVTTHTLVISHFLDMLLPGLVYSAGSAVLMKLEPSAVLPKSDGLLIFLALFLQFTLTICLALVGSFLAGIAPPTTSTALTVYLFLSLPVNMSSGMDLSKCIYICGLIPYMPLNWILKEACHLEDMGSGLTFTTMMKAHSRYTTAALLAYFYFVLQIILCLILFWYFDHVIPALYKSTYPWYFVFQKSYWSKTAPNPYLKTKRLDTQIQNSKYFEPPPEHLEAGIKVINVTKAYSKAYALDNVSVEVFKDEITILLGHNGAGKTTLMSIITGMKNATKGRVLVNGLDISSQKTQAQQHIRLCPQENIFLTNVSVIEHVMFFTLLKKGTFKEARESSKEILDKLQLKEKARKDISQLSGGMMRRAQLACALAGEASVLLLDEPTSGLDVETRRSMWDLLLSLRRSRTMLLTTHFMEEADALGDRVFALHSGQLRCHATPMYLKRAIGTGYRLTFTTFEEPHEPAITSVIKSVIPKATVKDIGFNSISYILPSANTRNFPKLFSKLESRKSQLGIDSIGVGTTTLEEVFLKLFSNVITDPFEENEMDDEENKHQKLTGAPLYLRQVMALIKRNLIFIWINKISQIVFGIILTAVLIIAITQFTNDSNAPKNDTSLVTMNLDMYGFSPDFKILYKLNGSDSILRPLSDQYPRVHFVKASDFGEAKLRTEQLKKMENGNYLAGIEFNDTNAKLMYTTKLRFTAPVVLNLLSNLVTTNAVPWASGRTLTAHNHPLPGAYTPYDFKFKLPKSHMSIKFWVFCITMLLLSSLTYMVDLPCKEATGARHIHVLAGCSPELHWLSMLLSGFLQVLITHIPILIIACTFFEYNNTFTDSSFLIAISVVVLLGSMAMLAFSYYVTLKFSRGQANIIIIISIVFSMFIFPSILLLVPAAASFKLMVLILLPPFTLYEAMDGCGMTAGLNALCNLNKNMCPYLWLPFPHFDGGKCCEAKSNAWCYFCDEDYAPGNEIMYQIVQIFLYMTFVVVTQRGTFYKVEEMLANPMYRKPVLQCDEVSVKAERAYVKKAIKLQTKVEKYDVCCSDDIPDVMLVSDVQKTYRHACTSFLAVKGVSFSIKKGECFGVLGVNGAGKSTLFRMLIADLCPSKGRIFANGHELTFPYSTEYLFRLGYCPQFWGLNDFLTGRQNLSLLLALNGLNAHDTNTETKAWIKLVGLEKYTDTRVSSYSGGCLRRMAAASALCTGASITVLDEPTSGVDVAARRRVWFAVKRALYEDRAIILTSHSLDEIEALCDRIAIMVAGEICALGSPAALRATYSSGHTVIMKIKYEHAKRHRSGVIRSKQPKINLLKAAMQKKFKCTLKDEHKTMLHYHIHKTMQYSKLFREMEQLRANFPGLIEDYSVSETTLEEVFLSFGKRPEPVEELSERGKRKRKRYKDSAVGLA